MKKRHFIAPIAFLMISCGDIERDKQLIFKGKLQENLRIKECQIDCQKKEVECSEKVWEKIKKALSANEPTGDLFKESKECSEQMNKCFNNCILSLPSL